MLMMVEGFVRSEGGVGVLLLNQEKFLNFAQVYAIAAAIIAVGILQDWALALTRDALFPYAALQEKRA
jgi:ABC-type nitrate/sulfonate/bicarbonate transport system permease component